MQRAKRLKSIVEAEKKAKDKLDKTVDGWVDDKKRMRRLEALKVAVVAQVKKEEESPTLARPGGWRELAHGRRPHGDC